jgi:hypothetical protein
MFLNNFKNYKLIFYFTAYSIKIDKYSVTDESFESNYSIS